VRPKPAGDLVTAPGEKQSEPADAAAKFDDAALQGFARQPITYQSAGLRSDLKVDDAVVFIRDCGPETALFFTHCDSSTPTPFKV